MVNGPELCEGPRVSRLVTDFFGMWSRQDADGVIALFANPLQLQDGLPDGRTVLHNRDELKRYLLVRFELQEKLVVVNSEVPQNPEASEANATIAFRREIGTTILHGNAKLVCKDGLIAHVIMTAE